MTLHEARIPPHSIEAETAVLGSILLDNDALSGEILGQLTPEDFYRRAHTLIFTAMQHLRSTLSAQPGEPSPVDLVTLTEELRRRGQLDEVGGAVYLTGLMENVPTAVYADHYARIVQEKSVLRQKIAAAAELMRACFDQQIPLEDIDTLTARIPSLPTAAQDIRELADDLDSAMQQAESGTGPNGAPTGLSDLDRAIGGLEAGRLYVLAGRPAMGKSALGFQIGLHVARTRGRVLGFSLEMPTQEISTRLLCSEARVDLSRFNDARRGNRKALNPRDWERLRYAQEQLRHVPFRMIARPGLRLQELLDTVRRQHDRDPLSLFVLDYVQLVQVSGKAAENPVQRVTLVSNALKSLGMELGIPVLALAQLSRSVESRPNKRPLLSDLRESGSLEQDADAVLFIYRDEYYDPKTEQEGIAEIIIGKQRNGPTSTINTRFFPAYTRFTNLDTYHHEESAA